MLKLGIIGLSEGNGHPYSWSAIFNGYQPSIMEGCPFPVIPAYLAKERFPEAMIAGAKVTHIWTQDIAQSHHVAQASCIPNVVNELEDLIGNVDAILLARDDANNHYTMAAPFLNAGLPIYIDKPLALTTREAEKIFSLEKYSGQVFTCSALQFSNEFVLPNEVKLSPDCHISAYIKNDWNKYAIHLIEPVIKMIGYEHGIRDVKIMSTSESKSAFFVFSNGMRVDIHTDKNFNASPTIYVEDGAEKRSLIFQNTYQAFKSALQVFIDSARERKPGISKAFVMKSIEMIERANEIT